MRYSLPEQDSRRKIIEDMLPICTRPARYIGNEWNAIKKDWEKVRLKVALVFPDTYEVGQSGLGLRILYHLLNEDPEVVAERVFAPWPDMERNLRESGTPLFSMESMRELGEFDVVGFTLQYEMTYTNVLNILSLARIPLKASSRGERDPMIIGGGPCVFNPEPLAEFFDFFVLGDGEEVLPEILQVLKEARGSKATRLETLLQASGVPGVYVPSFYEILYKTDGTIGACKPKLPGVPEKITKRVVKDLDSCYFPTKPVVPFVDTVHDRVALEIFRGCTRGCRFCQAGMIYRPVRERSRETLFHQAQESIKNTGYEEISLLSLSCTDYSRIEELVRDLLEEYRDKYLEISLPSLRIDSFSLKLARMVQRFRRTGLTFAPEAGTARMRALINKGATEEDLLETVERAKQAGWETVKFYFMIGLPGEEKEDILGIADLVRKVLARSGLRLNISIASFVPKPWTPFQWEPFEAVEHLKGKLVLLRKMLRHAKVHLSWHSPELSFLEATFARGDRKLSPVLRLAWERGARFDGWAEHFSPAIWEQSFREAAIDPNFYASRKRFKEEIFPWDHLSPGVRKEFLWDERMRAKTEEQLPDCRILGCQECGVCTQTEGGRVGFPEDQKSLPEVGYPPFKMKPVQKIRMEISKGEEVRLISHLDLVRALERALRRCNLPLAYTEGFHPRIRMSFGHALSLGYLSSSEWVDVELGRKVDPRGLKRRLNENLPGGIIVQEAREIPLRSPSLGEILGMAVYEVTLDLSPGSIEELRSRVTKMLAQNEIWAEKKGRKMEVRSMIHDIRVKDHGNAPLRLEFQIRLSPKGSIKPDELLVHIAEGFLPLKPVRIERTGLFTRMGREWVKP